MTNGESAIANGTDQAHRYSLLTLPNSLSRAERRRSPRRRLQEPTEVAIHTTGAHTGWHCHGSLLNLSPEGIACRLRDEDAAALECGQSVRVVFGLGNSLAVFDLIGQVITITQGGTPKRSVIGLQFVADQEFDANRVRLHEALDARDSPGL